MTVFSSNLSTKLSQSLFLSKKNYNFSNTHVKFVFFFRSHNHLNFSRNPIFCLSKSNKKTQFFQEMETIDSNPAQKYTKELEVAVKAVDLACLLCQKVQENLIFNGNEDVQSKNDNSPVTIADWSVQATISWTMSREFGPQNTSIVAEEDIEALSNANLSDLLSSVTKTINEYLSESTRFGIDPPASNLRATDVLDAISRCNSTGGPKGRFWVMDPVDGTLGFVRGDQYAVALALVENGEPVLGVLGCPNYPMNKDWSNYPNGYRKILSKLTKSNSTSWESHGCVLYAKRSSGEAWMQPLLSGGDESFIWPNGERRIKVSAIDNPSLATVCEPVEKANSNHSFTQGLARSVGVSMVKYAAIARGDAEIFMKFSRGGYKEKIWDHAAEVVIVEEAGGVVTDAGGWPLDFSKGMYLQGLDRGIIACAGASLHDKIMTAVDASWSSSSL